MTRRSFLLALAILALLGGVTATGVMALVRFEPNDYASATLPPGPQRFDHSQKFYTAFTRLLSDLNTPGDWDATFTQQEINSYLNEGFVQSGLSERLLPDQIGEPRVVIEKDKLRLAFRYGSGFWSTIISVDMKLWLSKREPNVLALQLHGFHAGALPISMQSLLERVSEVGRQNGIDITWYRHESLPVALLRFQADQPRPTLQLRAVSLEPGVIRIQGNSGDATAAASLSPGTSLKPIEK